MGSCCDKSDVKNLSRKNSAVSRKTSMILDKYSIQMDYKKRYEYLSNIGNGGFGKVRLFRDRKFPDMQYAIKTVKKDFITSHGMRSVIREVEIIKKLDHPNIVNYIETYEDELYIHIVMEYIPGQNLLSMVSAKPYMSFGEKDVYEIMQVLIKTVYFLHINNVVHRDLKPENILFSISGDYQTLKLIDFGLSIGQKEKDTYRVGSPYYMAPEMIKGVFNFASDVWSIGVIMFFMITGKQAFGGGKDRENVFTRIQKGKYDLALLKKTDCSPELKDLIQRILVVDMNKRISIQAILEHSWIKLFKQDPNSIKLNREILDSIRDFHNKNVLQKEILFVMAKIAKENEIQKLKQAFKIIDKSNSGEIEYSEIPNIFEKLGIKPDEGEVDDIWNTLDFHTDGKVNYTEFLAATLSSVNFSKDERLWAVFRYFDVNETGFITADNIIDTVKASHLQVNEKDLNEVFKSLKTGGGGTNCRLNFDEFKNAFYNSHISNSKTTSISNSNGNHRK